MYRLWKGDKEEIGYSSILRQAFIYKLRSILYLKMSTKVEARDKVFIKITIIYQGPSREP